MKVIFILLGVVWCLAELGEVVGPGRVTLCETTVKNKDLQSFGL